MHKLKFLIFFIVANLAITITSHAQTSPAKFGYLSYNTIFKEMPEYAVAQKKLNELKSKYDKEAARSESEFERKFAEFLQGQKDFPDNILKKRQNELQELLEESVRFKEEAQNLLKQAEKDLQADMLYILNEAIRAVGIEKGYSFILNTDGNICPFINTSSGEDASNYVREKLKLPITTTPPPSAQ